MICLLPGTAPNPPIVAIIDNDIQVQFVSERRKKNLTISAPSPGAPEILEKTSHSQPHPLDPRKSRKKPHNITHLLGLKKATVHKISQNRNQIIEFCKNSLIFQKSLQFCKYNSKFLQKFGYEIMNLDYRNYLRLLVLGCMDSYDSEQRHILKDVSRSTRLALFYTFFVVANLVLKTV